MEKNSKYYSIIENLIRGHKKFAGLEAIVEDIIDDVYSHSEVILNTVTNEAVVNAYLSKVVSTSIITVPKKMNFHSELNHRIISHDTIKTPIPTVTESYTKVDNSLVDKMINSSQKVENSMELTKEAEEKEETTVLETELSANDDYFEEEISFSENDNEGDLQELSLEEDAVQMYPDEFLEDTGNNDIQDLIIEEETNIVEPEEVLLTEQEEEVQDSIIEEPLDIVELENEFDIEETENNQEELISEDALDIIDSEDTLIEENNNVQEFELSALSPEELNLEDDSVDLLAEETPVETLDINIETPEQDIVENIDSIQDNTEIKNTNHVATDYSKFQFTPDMTELDDDFDIDLIKKELETLDSKKPELNVLSVYNLKYKDNLSISEISLKLDMSENSIIQTLNEIIAVI